MSDSTRGLGVIAILFVLALLFWSKIKAMLAPAGTVTATMEGGTLTAGPCATSLCESNVGAFAPVASNAPAVTPYVPDSPPPVTGGPADAAAANPNPFAGGGYDLLYSSADVANSAGLSPADLAAISDQMHSSAVVS